MGINFTCGRPEERPGSAPLAVGWFLAQTKGAVPYDLPERVMIRPKKPLVPKMRE